MFSCVSVAPGIYSFRLIPGQEEFIEIKDRERLMDPLKFVNSTKDYERRILTEGTCLGSTIDIAREDCLSLLSECTADFCPCSRTVGLVNRDLIEHCIEDIIVGAKNVVSIGPGGMHQDFRILSGRQGIDYYVLDGFKDFFSMVSSSIDPYEYTGPADEHALKRAKWFSLKCMLYGTFLRAVGDGINLHLCESADHCVEYLKGKADTVVLGIDIIDDYAEYTMGAFNRVTTCIPCTAITVSAGYWNIFINSGTGEKVVISTGQNNLFNLYAVYILYRLNKRCRKRLTVIATGLAIVSMSLIAHLFLDQNQ